MLYDPTRKWVRQGSCRTVDPAVWFAPGGPPDRTPIPAVQASWNEAKKICSSCPVLAECRRDTLGEEFGVWGGLDEHERYLLRKKLYMRAKHWSPELRLAWGKELHSLRKAGVSWVRIRAMTGIGDGQLAAELTREWTKHLEAAKQATALVVDLPLPEPLQFPPMAGRGHAWVRRAGLVSSALYRGETADGEWLLMSLMAGGRHNSHAWVPKRDVQLHHPQAVVVLEYIGRPDGPHARAS